MSHSIVEQFSSNGRSSCGYCKQSASSKSSGMYAHKLSIDDYQSLIDRGWRRSGIYCYKPIMDETCCPAYTIKCDAENFKLSKSQKKILNKFNRCINNDIIPVKTCEDYLDETKAETSKSKAASVSHLCDSGSMTPLNNVSTIKKGTGPDPNRAPCKKAKLIRLERNQVKNKLKPTEKVNEKLQNKEKSLEDLVTSLNDKLKIKLVRTAPPSNEWKATENISHSLYQKYQMIIHGDSPQKCSNSQFKRFLVDSPLKIVLLPTTSRDIFNSFEVESVLFKKYQMTVHNESPEDCDSETFRECFFDSPLEAETRDSVNFGSFHQQYWLNDQLIAVGVIDILPKCVSSVYFFYDPAYGNLSLGTYGALREIEFTRKLQKKYSNIKNYYMGFYIHSCPKMRYKGNYYPSYLLCPETYSWFPLKDCVEKLDKNKYSRLNPDNECTDWNEFSESDLNQLLVLNTRNNKCFKYGNLMMSNIHCDDLDTEHILLYGKLIGKECSQRLVLVATF